MNLFALTLISMLFVFASQAQSQILSTQDSINVFYDKFFEELEANYIYTDETDWKKIKSDILEEALEYDSFDSALKVCPKLFDTIGGNHTSLFYKDDFYNSNLRKEITQEQLHKSLLNAYVNTASYHVKVIEKKYGYVFIPGMLLLDATQKELDSAAQKIYDEIIAIDTTQTIEGWIIDVRLNTGGNSNVMLTGLYHLLGDGTACLYLDKDKNVTSRNGLIDGKFYDNHKLITEIKTSKSPKPKVPVAVLTGIMSASAGEYVAMGFRGRENVILIGEESYGLTTANDLFDLPFVAKAAITLSYGTDRTANYTETIVPDIEIIKEANFEDLSKDKNVIEAIKFINSK